ncbi:MAG: 4Fe-4S binding protein [Deltaproteobacteria bacterium]|nr:4Fe-4S binding protein [Deltaproteobacteria bacterium]MBW2536534.1 4Fe-4S binding protein [Deltaproteobacteria bacterium]
MTADSSASGRPLHGRWVIKVDTDRCSLCESCAKHCPTGALRRLEKEQALELRFLPALCNGCAGGEGCEAICPEQAITRWDRTPQAPEREVLLVEGELATCTYCGDTFAPTRKLDAVERKRQREVVRDYCPLCRREQLVVRFIEERRVPGSEAEYRSAKDILRRTGHLPSRRKRTID